MVQFCTCISVTPCSYIRDVPIVLVAIGSGSKKKVHWKKAHRKQAHRKKTHRKKVH